MNNSKALIVGSYSEGFGRMTAESNMLGIPVLGRNSAGTKEILDQTQGGFKFETTEELINSMKLVNSMSEIEIDNFMKGPKRIANELFSNEKHVEKILGLYKSIVTDNGGGYACKVVFVPFIFTSIRKVA